MDDSISDIPISEIRICETARLLYDNLIMETPATCDCKYEHVLDKQGMV